MSDDNWEFHQGLDSNGNDIEFRKNVPINELKVIALKNPECMAFNTMGFLKSKVTLPLTKSEYFSPVDGIYVRKTK